MDRLLMLSKQLSHPISLLIFGGVCCIMTLFFHIHRTKTMSALEEKAFFLFTKKQGIEERQKLEANALAQMKEANKVYIEEILANLQFLKGEIAKLQILVHENPQNSLLTQRLDFLQNGNNGLRLKEQNHQRVGNLQEVEVSLAHPVELGREDLIYLLSQLENVPLGSSVPEHHPPYFLIRQFDLLKKTQSSNEETFVLNLQMIKQEIVHE